MVTKEIKLHKIQTQILLDLLLNPVMRFSGLNKRKVSTDKFNFHIKKLIKDGLITKDKEGFYTLTQSGKEFSNRFDTENKEIEKQAKIGVRIVCLKTVGKDVYCLLDQRLKQPYWGYWGLPGGKIRWGEEVLEAARRELKEETGLLGKVALVGVKHKMDYDKEGLLLEDKFFFVCVANNLSGKLKQKYEGGRNEWIKVADLSQKEKLFDGVTDSIKIALEKHLVFIEKKYKVSGY